MNKRKFEAEEETPQKKIEIEEEHDCIGGFCRGCYVKEIAIAIRNGDYDAAEELEEAYEREAYRRAVQVRLAAEYLARN